MPETKFGEQPAYRLLYQQRWTVPRVAEEIGVPVGHLRLTLLGRVRPMPAVREELPKLLGVPLRKLFTPPALAKPYAAKKNPWRPL